MARMLGVSVRMLVSWKTGDSASKTAEHRLRLLGRAVDSYGDQPPERIRYLLFAPKNGVCDYDRIRLKDRRKIINGPIGSVCDYL